MKSNKKAKEPKLIHRKNTQNRQAENENLIEAIRL
jgi:hypothetical protein